MVVASIGLGGCHPSAESRVRIGYVPIAASLPLFVAVEEGYLKDAGIDFELVRFNTSNDLALAGSAGRVDFMMPCALNVIFDAAAVTGTKHKLFGVNIYSDQPPNVADFLLTQKSSTVSSLEQLRGKRIAGHPGSATAVVLQLILGKAGIGPTEFTFVPLNPPEWEPALLGKTVDAVAALEPQASQIVADGAANVLVKGFYALLMPDLPLSGYWVTASYAQSGQQRLIDATVSAFARAVDLARHDPERAKSHILKYVSVREDVLPSMQLNGWLVGREIDAGRIQQMADTFADHGVMQKHINVEDFLLTPANK